MKYDSVYLLATWRKSYPIIHINATQFEYVKQTTYMPKTMVVYDTLIEAQYRQHKMLYADYSTKIDKKSIRKAKKHEEKIKFLEETFPEYFI